MQKLSKIYVNLEAGSSQGGGTGGSFTVYICLPP